LTSWHGQLSLHAFRPSEPVFENGGRAASDRFILARLINPVEKRAIFRVQSSNAEFSTPFSSQLQLFIALAYFRRFVESWNNLEYLGRISKKTASSHWRLLAAGAPA
jgi:hypothetical protein